MENDNDVPPPTRDQFEHRKDFVRAYDRWRDKHDPRRKKRVKAGLSSDEYQRLGYARNRERRLAAKKADYEANRAKFLDRQATWRDGNRHKLAARDRRRYEADKPKFYANNARRRAQEMQAAPSWLTKEQWDDMAEKYADAQRMTEITGIPHDVDHIWPLRGKRSCGLHVPWNLQVLPAAENRRKRNVEPAE
jgi:hypothetical protein